MLPVGAVSELIGTPTTMAITAGLGLASGVGLMVWYAGQARKPREVSVLSSQP
ncbi:MAG TPA: hypothetical protein PKD27_05480 [Tepidiformaceae bacterium]|nr:hypothetical protein [Tepidiformaceae bacterium]